MQTEGKKQNRGFASMDRERQREIARKGGRAAHEKGTAHQFTSDEARAAGRKGGERVSVDRRHMAEIGRLGGKSSAGRRGSNAQGEGGDQPGNAADSNEHGNSPEPAMGGGRDEQISTPT
ncbi:MAG TPA: KGG domain-containing protein [Tepidisphaeraceae bacterium]|nr:KGG domain-containing protein [Tepidisphaeraceae bacterium]